jgi:hypothetical protein
MGVRDIRDVGPGRAISRQRWAYIYGIDFYVPFTAKRTGYISSLDLVTTRAGPPSFGGSGVYVYPGRLLERSLGRKVYEADPMVCPK